MRCPACSRQLQRSGRTWPCADGHGSAITVSALRHEVASEPLSRLWRAARAGEGIPGRPCPSCQTAMREIPPEGGGAPVPLDVCARCHIVWCDAGELEALPRPQTAAETPLRELPLEARKALALARLEQQRAQDDDTPEYDEGMVGLLYQWGFPVERGATPPPRLPWATWTLVLALAVMGLLTLGLDDLDAAWAFRAGAPLGHNGLRWITSLFVDNNGFTWFAGFYLLVTFGDNVEGRLGAPIFLALVLAAHAASLLVAGVRPLEAGIRVGGAGGVVAAVGIFYALSFPHARIHMLGALDRGFFQREEFRIAAPAWLVFVGWLVFHTATAWAVAGDDLVLLTPWAGLGVGLVAWVLWR